MKTKLLILIILIHAAFTIYSSGQTVAIKDKAHAPKKGSSERKAILDALRTEEFRQFKVYYIKSHNGWAWVDMTPLDAKGKAVAEGGPSLLRYEKNGKWKVIDLSKVPEDPDNPMGAVDASPVYIQNLLKTFPGVPSDIFPDPAH